MEEKINEMLSCNSFPDLDSQITKDKIKKAISSLKYGKATELDKISCAMIKASVNVLLSVYEKLFHAILRSGIYPTSWHDSYICLIYKSGYYRDIAITNILGKVFSMILNNRIENFIASNNLIDDTQIGFKKNGRRSDHMFILQTLIEKYVKELKSSLHVCFVDFRKAYDSVWRQALMFKLLSQNVSGMFFRIVKAMYTNRNICVKINNYARTIFFKSNVGVLQGVNISPQFFNLYISDLKAFLGVDDDTPKLVSTPINCLMYIDDLLLMSRSE